MSVSPSSRFHRIIKKLDRYVEVGAIELDTAYLSVLEGAQPLGVYRGDVRSEDIVFTDQECVFTDRSGCVRRIAYEAIQTVEYPLPASDSIELTLQLTDMSAVTIYVVGRQGSYRDVFEVGRFFARVAEDAGRGSSLTPMP